jgi:hypothetical protein
MAFHQWAEMSFAQMVLGASGQYKRIREAIELRLVKRYVTDKGALAESASAYDGGDGNMSRKGNFVLRVRWSW